MMDWLKESWILIPNWKWLGFVVALFCGFTLKSLLSYTFSYLKKSERVNARLHRFLNYFLKTPIEKPLGWIGTVAFWRICLDNLTLPETFDKYLRLLSGLLFSYSCIVLVYYAAESMGKVLEDFFKKTTNTLDDQLGVMITKTLKVVVVILGVLVVMQNFGINVFSLIAGLGLGGLALALAAQDTAANVFGSITIILDRPFQVGDLIRVGDTEGIVEEIGFRSTRIRTGYNSLVTIPNATIAKEKIDNLQLRPSRRIRHVLGITYDTDLEKAHAFIHQIQLLLKADKRVQADSYTVHLQDLGDFNLQILLNYFVLATTIQEERIIQQEILFNILNLAKLNSIEFAFPTQTHFVKQVN